MLGTMAPADHRDKTFMLSFDCIGLGKKGRDPPLDDEGYQTYHLWRIRNKWTSNLDGEWYYSAQYWEGDDSIYFESAD